MVSVKGWVTSLDDTTREGAPVLVGRDDELAVLVAATEDVRKGRRSVLVVRGEAGIGKSSLVDAAVRSASGI